MTSVLRIGKTFTKFGILEIFRRKDLYVVLILTALMCFGAWTFNFFGVSGLELFIKDVALTAIGVMSTIITVMISGRQISEEIQRRTIYPVLARPISRFQFMLGKWIAASFTCTLVFLLLASIAFGAFILFGLPVPPIVFQYLLLKIMGIVWLSAVTIGLSTMITPSANITICLLLAFGSGMLSRLLILLHADSAISTFFTNLLYGIFPHYDFFDLSAKVTYGWPPISWEIIGILCFYSLATSLAWLSIGWVKFRKQSI